MVNWRMQSKAMTEKLYKHVDKHVDGAWTEVEARAKKVKETLGIGKPETSESSRTSADSGTKANESHKSSSEEHKQHQSGPQDTSETLFNMVKSGAASVLPNISLFSQKLKDTKVVDLANKGFHIVKDELSSNPSKRKRIEYEPSPAAIRTNVESTVTDITVVPPKQSPLNKKWEAFKEKMRRHPMFKCVSGLSEPVVNKSQEILHISEVEVRETKMMGDIPLIIVQFQTQQVHCVRDRVGAIVEGSQDTINMVHYLWAMAQMDVEEAGEGALFPIWRLWDMQQVGIRALI